jgi:hypothetical protein
MRSFSLLSMYDSNVCREWELSVKEVHLASQIEDLSVKSPGNNLQLPYQKHGRLLAGEQLFCEHLYHEQPLMPLMINDVMRVMNFQSSVTIFRSGQQLCHPIYGLGHTARIQGLAS